MIIESNPWLHTALLRVQIQYLRVVSQCSTNFGQSPLAWAMSSTPFPRTQPDPPQMHLHAIPSDPRIYGRLVLPHILMHVGNLGD